MVANRPLIVAFGAVVLAFIAATACSAYSSLAIERAALAIANHEAPAIEHLAEGRAAVRELQLLVSRWARGDAERAPSGELDRARRRFDGELGAVEPSPELSRSLGALDAKVWRLLQLDSAAAPGAGELVGEVLRAGDDTARVALRDLERAAARSHDLALRIEAVHHRSLGFAFVLDGVSVLFAIIAAWLLRRSLAQQAALAEAHRKLLAERASDLDQFAGRVAHDVLGPLSTVLYAVTLAADRVDDPKTRRLLERGRASTMRVKETVLALLDFARSGAHGHEHLYADVGAAVESVVDELSAEAELAHVELVVEPSPPCAVACAPGILSSVLSNLARNAIKYLDDPDARRVAIRVVPQNARVRVEIADTGPGVPPALAAEIFKPYVRLAGAAQNGLGLGLAIVARLVEAHDGSVGVRPAHPRGSVFWFELPAAPHEPEKEVTAAPP